MSAELSQFKSAHQQYCEYVDHGFAIVPIDGVSKGPTKTGWNERDNCIAVPGSVPKNLTQGGLAHLYSGTAAFDIDDLVKARAHFKKHDIDIDEYLNAKNAVRIESGRENRSKLIYNVPKKLAKKLLTRNHQAQGYELRCCTQKSGEDAKTVQDVLPPSIHPDTKQPYQWKGDWRNLPPLPKKLKKYWLKLLERKSEPVRNSNDLFKVVMPQIASALKSIDPDCDYETWREIGMALHAADHGDKWIEWSSEGNKYKSGECEKRLDGFDPQGGITISTLFRHAREAGWVCETQSPYTLNDLGNAQRLALFVADRFRYIADLDINMVWSDRGWIKDRSNTLYRSFKKVIEAMLLESNHLDSKQGKPLYAHAKTSGNAAKIKAACDLARMEAPIRTLSDQWDAAGDLITFSCGTVLNIRTMKSRAMHQGDLIRRRINAPFDMEAKCPEFNYLINHLVDGDPEARSWLLQLWSTGLISSFRQKIIFVLYGASNSGKTTTVEVVKRMLGDFAVSPPSNFIIKPKYPNSGGPDAEIANLLGKRAAFISEFPRGRLDDNKLKNLTGSDTMTVRRLYSNEFIDVPCRLTITISAQAKPFFDATDAGMLTRIRSLHARKPLDFEKKPQRADAEDWIIEREAAGIAALFVRSLRELIESGGQLPESKRIIEDTAELNLANDRVGMFLEKRCDVAEEHQERKSFVFTAYKAFCEEDNHQPFIARTFHEVMRETHGFGEKRIDGHPHYVGVELKGESL